MPGPIAVRGLRELSAAFAQADRETRAGFRAEFRDLAEPVRRDAEALARSGVPRIGDAWAQMRTGVTRRVVYVAPKQRGVKGRGDDRRRRPNLAPLLMNRALEPALDRHTGEIEDRLERTLDRLAGRWEH